MGVPVTVYNGRCCVQGRIQRTLHLHLQAHTCRGCPPTGEHQGPTDTQSKHWAVCTAVSVGRCPQARVDHKLGAGSQGQGWDRHAKDLQEVQEGLGAPSAPADHEAPARGKSKDGSDSARNPSPLPCPQPPSATPLPRASAAEAGLPGSVANSPFSSASTPHRSPAFHLGSRNQRQGWLELIGAQYPLPGREGHVCGNSPMHRGRGHKAVTSCHGKDPHPDRSLPPCQLENYRAFQGTAISSAFNFDRTFSDALEEKPFPRSLPLKCSLPSFNT